MPDGDAAFEILIPVKPEDIDELDHVNNVTYVRWVQDAAVAHWRSLASGDDQASVLWVVVRHEIDYKRPALFGDVVVARTWVGTATRATFERHTELLRESDRTLLARARTLWCPVDAYTRRPIGVSPAIRSAFSSPGE